MKSQKGEVTKLDVPLLLFPNQYGCLQTWLDLVCISAQEISVFLGCSFIPEFCGVAMCNHFGSINSNSFC